MTKLEKEFPCTKIKHLKVIQINEDKHRGYLEELSDSETDKNVATRQNQPNMGCADKMLYLVLQKKKTFLSKFFF